MKRRKLLLGTTGLLTALAGCNTITGNNKDTDSPNNTTETTPTNSADISVDISTSSQPGQLPPIWRNHSIEDFQAQFQVETSGNVESVNVSNEKVQIGPDSSQWNDNTVTVQPGQMKKKNRNSQQQHLQAALRPRIQHQLLNPHQTTTKST